jgi:hypothetical protein
LQDKWHPKPDAAASVQHVDAPEDYRGLISRLRIKGAAKEAISSVEAQLDADPCSYGNESASFGLLVEVEI